MRRYFTGRTFLLLLAIAFAAGMMWVRNAPPEVEDPLADAQKEVLQNYGFETEQAPPKPGASGVVVTKVTPGTPAQFMGLAVGDQLMAVNERSVWHAVNVKNFMSSALQHGPVSLLVKRGTEFKQIVFGTRSAQGMGRAGGAPGASGPGRSPGRSPAGRGAPTRGR